MGSAKAHYDGIVAFSLSDFTEDLRKICLGNGRLIAVTDKVGDCSRRWATAQQAKYPAIARRSSRRLRVRIRHARLYATATRDRQARTSLSRPPPTE